MAEPTIQLGGGNWAGKTDNLLGYYKEGERFYKQDFTFSRTTTGTYTDSDGYIQEMPYNLLQQSNQFDTTWTLSASIDLTSGQSGYDGSNDAWLLKRNSTGSRYVQQNLTRPSGQYSFSVYLKAESTDWVYVWAYDGSNQVNAYFDLNNGVVGNTSGLDSTNVVSVGNDWYRCTITFTQAITSVRIYPAYANGSISTGTDNGIYIQDAQLNKGTSAKTYFPTTTRLNMPRVDYLNNFNGSLILEPQRTNLVTYSSDFSNAAWINTEGVTIDANDTTSPDGTTNADKIIPQATSDYHRIKQSLTITASTPYTFSCFVKKADYNYFTIRTSDSHNNNVGFNLLNGTITYQASGYSGFIESYGNGWYRIGYVRNFDATNIQIGLRPQPTEQTDNNIAVFTANGTDGVYLYGAQLEAGSYPTTLINTSGSSVTRNADACTDGGDASRFNDNEGVLFFEGSALSDGTNQRWIAIGSGSNANRVSIHFNATNRISCSVRGSSSAIYDANFNIGSQTNNTKAAIKYKDSDYAFFVNGVKVDSQQSGSLNFNASLSELAFDSADGGSPFYGKTKQIQYYNTALTDQELITLTTL